MTPLPLLTDLWGAHVALDPWFVGFVAASAFAFGAAIGSFLNVCVARMPIMSLVAQYKEGDAEVRRELVASLDENPVKARTMMDEMVGANLGVAKPRSHCPNCRNMIAWYDNIPIASWILLRARCRHCALPISPMYPLVELVSGLIAVTLVLRFGVLVGPIYFAIYAAMLVITGVDLAIFEIPDEIVLPGIPLGLLASVALPVDFVDAVIGVAAGGGIPLAIAKGYLAVTGREGLGMGDVKMLAMIGAFFGWQGVIAVLLIASALGSVVGIGWLVATRRAARSWIPFGPFLALGTMVYMLVGPKILDWYLGFFS